ncbi:MAG: hypothetical protein ACOC7J_00285 [Armatimonadota bacterium]
MNLLHHLVIGERLRQKLQWPNSLRGQMSLGSIAPDAHTEVPGLGRSAFHPRAGSEPVDAVLGQMRPADWLDQSRGRAFAVAVIGHLVADELTRRHDYHLPPHAPAGFQPVENEDFDDPDVIDITGITRSLMYAHSKYGLGVLRPEAIDRKRWEVLGRWPLTERRGRYLVVEPLATLVGHCTGEALTRMYGSQQCASLLGSWRP